MELSKHNKSTNFDTACGIDGISHENLGRIPAGVAGGIYGFQPEYLGKIHYGCSKIPGGFGRIPPHTFQAGRWKWPEQDLKTFPNFKNQDGLWVLLAAQYS